MEIKRETEKVRKLRDLSIHYFGNAIRFLKLGELEKASEFLWGSIAESLKAIAATKAIELKSHEDIREYARQVSKELQDEGVWYVFDQAQGLHSNFYESGLKKEYVEMSAENVRKVLSVLNSLLPEELI